jgi:diacylglycerol kinase family enzyme
MKTVKLLHNPKSGDEEHSAEKLVSLIESAGYKCLYANTKEKGWDTIEPETDFIIIAGGDGTIRKVVITLLNGTFKNKKYPITLLPLGTANNISKSLNITGEVEDIISCIDKCGHIHYDVAQVSGLPEAAQFLEGFGFGVFPELMEKMESMEKANKNVFKSPEEELLAALKTLEEITHTYKAVDCKIEIDGKDYSGKYLLVEIMNIRSIGPNLDLNPNANPTDGLLEVVLVPEADRDKFTGYIHNKTENRDTLSGFKPIQAKDIKIEWHGEKAHLDDKHIKLKNAGQLTIIPNHELLEFIVPN